MNDHQVSEIAIANNQALGSEPRGSAGGQPRRGFHILIDFLIGLLFTALFISGKILIEHTAFGEQMKLLNYNLLHLRLSSVSADEVIPLTIIDITKLEQETFTIDGRTGKATPREQLLALLKAVVEQKPAAVGVDIDFSPNSAGYMTPRDPQFFQACLDLSKNSGVPIFLGAGRSQMLPPKDWLGVEDFSELGASIIIPKDDNKKMWKWAKPVADAEPGQTLSGGLAKAYNRPSGEQSELHNWALEQVSERRFTKELTVGEFLVDFSPLDLLERYRIETKNPDTIRDVGRMLRGNMVLIGDATPGQAADAFSVPVRVPTVPGIYLHACAAYTLAKAPLYELTGKGRIVVDLVLSVIVLLSLMFIRLYYHNQPDDAVDTGRLQRFFTSLVVALAFIVGVIFVRSTRVMWDDFILVIIVLLLHPTMERFIVSAGRWLFKHLKSSLDSIALKGKREETR